MAWVESTLDSGDKHFRDTLGNSGKADHVAIKNLFRGGKPDAASLGIYRLLLLVRTGEDLESPKDIGRVLNDARVIFNPPPPIEDYERLQEKREAADTIFSSLPCADPDPDQIRGDKLTTVLWDYLLWLRDDFSVAHDMMTQLRAAATEASK
ncbi:hypothetical protein TeGR_g9914 [Tetraparma gracilis]|jgi:hypothetical protein|uniref:Uncharacterized protein n=1 Tax=Tetraparma gracilis TaxID=2962635 RepID=A0ABQ6MEA0_9STRA|nr:hypothetical protein TeGR_g9914 [Tetraparma gracilis]